MSDNPNTPVDLAVRMKCPDCTEEAVVHWSEFLAAFDTHVVPGISVSLVINFPGSREGRREVEIDAHIKRVLAAFGMSKSARRALIGNYSSRHAMDQ